MKVAVYTRISTKREEQLSSLRNQREYYTKYCGEKGYSLFELYADEGLSATSPKRKNFLKMIFDAGLDEVRDQETNDLISFRINRKRKPMFNLIICKDVSRFSRNIDSMALAKTLNENGVYVFFENAGFSTNEKEHKDWILRLSLLLTFSQQESIDRSEKVSWAYKKRAEDGKFHMSTALYGYSYNPESNQYYPNDDEAKVVREIFDMYASGEKGLNTIANILNNKGLTTRKGYKWRASSLKRMIRNEKYKGLTIARKLTTTGVTSSNKVIKRDESEWKVIDDKIPAIIDEETWNKAQEVINNRVKEMSDGTLKGSKQVKNIFHHKIKCPKCKSDFVRVSTKKERKNGVVVEYIYYCRNRRMFGVNTCDMKGISHNVLIRELEKLVQGQMIRSMVTKVDQETEFFNKILDQLDERREEADSKRNEIQQKIDNVTNEIDSLLDNFMNGKASENVINAANRKIDKLEQNIKELEAEKLKYETTEIDKIEFQVMSKFKEIEELSLKTEFTFDELLNLTKRIIVLPNKELEFYFEFPTLLVYLFEEMDEVQEDQTFLHKYTVKY